MPTTGGAPAVRCELAATSLRDSLRGCSQQALAGPRATATEAPTRRVAHMVPNQHGGLPSTSAPITWTWASREPNATTTDTGARSAAMSAAERWLRLGRRPIDPGGPRRVNPADAHRHGTSAGPPSRSRVRAHPQVHHGVIDECSANGYYKAWGACSLRRSGHNPCSRSGCWLACRPTAGGDLDDRVVRGLPWCKSALTFGSHGHKQLQATQVSEPPTGQAHRPSCLASISVTPSSPSDPLPPPGACRQLLKDVSGQLVTHEVPGSNRIPSPLGSRSVRVLRPRELLEVRV